MRPIHRITGLLLATLGNTGGWAAPSGSGDIVPPPPPDVIGFCMARGTVDDPGATFVADNASAERLPDQIAAVEGASKWRCMGGKVFVCQDDASGDWCSRKDPSLVASKELKQLCAARKAASVPTAMTSYSSSRWRCARHRPVAFGTLPLDRRRFFRRAWVEYVIGAGGVPAPVTFSDGVR